MRFLERLATGKMVLVASLPSNDLKLAEAAIDGGVHAIKVHLNVEHRASKTKFGSLEQERERIETILVRARHHGVAVGLMPGAETVATRGQIEDLHRRGLSFIDCYHHDLPAAHLDIASVQKMVALGHPADLTLARSFKSVGIDFLEASIVDPARYGQPLLVEDLLSYHRLVEESGLPVFVPTQKKITSFDVPLLQRAGVRGIIIGAIVTGTDVDGMRRGVTEFMGVMDD